jgi:hypothetical protein
MTGPRLGAERELKISAHRMVDHAHHRQAGALDIEKAIGQGLVIEDHIEAIPVGAQVAGDAATEGPGLHESPAEVAKIFGGIGPALQVPPAKRAMAMMRLSIKIKRRDLGEADTRRQVGIRGARQDFHLMAASRQGGGRLAQIDPLPANPRI